MLNKFFKTLAIISPIILSACSHISGGISASTVPLSPGSYDELGKVEGNDCSYALLGMIPLSDGNETKDALEDALDIIPDTKALVQVTSDTYSQHWILWSNTCTQVYGTAVTFK